MSRPSGIPDGLVIELSRGTVLPGASVEADRWMAMLNDRLDECVATLDRERMAVEIVFRLRDDRTRQGSPGNVYSVPFGIAVALLLVAVEILIGVSIAHSDIKEGGRDSLWTLAFLATMAVLYLIWKTYRRADDQI